MPTPAEPRVLAEVGGFVVAEQGPLVVVVDRGTGGASTAAFVLGILAAVCCGFGVVAVLAHAELSPWLGAAVLLAGLGFAGATFGILRRLRHLRSRPVSSYRPTAIFDRTRRVFVDADGTIVAPLTEVHFDTRMQLASSSPMLVVVTPAGTRILKRGNPFNGGLGNLGAVLTAVVFAPPPR